MNVNLKQLVTKSVSGRDDFHFYVDELSENDYMPTYAGNADEKYSFDEMNDEFFKFLDKKRNENGVFVRLIFAEGINTTNGAEFKLQYCGKECVFKTNDIDDVLVFDFAEYGVKIRGDEITFGATIEGGCSQTPYFAEFGSDKANSQFISLDNPLNRCIIKIMEEIIND